MPVSALNICTFNLFYFCIVPVRGSLLAAGSLTGGDAYLMSYDEMDLPGHYLGAVNVTGDRENWSREYSLEIRPDGSYKMYVKDEDGFTMLEHSGTSGRSLAVYVVRNGFDYREIYADIRDIDDAFAREYKRIVDERTG